MENNVKILLIDDDPELNKANRCIFEVYHYTVFTATTLMEAHRLIDEAHPDIIIMEVELPDGNGFVFCKEISGKTEAEILFLTANTEQKDMLRGLKLGAAYITKPFRSPELIARVEAVARRQKGTLLRG